ncbi:TPA: hypothetical protein DDZ75_03545, partial [Patescibacteria group bacterium]|nr:hypothetical protein [Patescibacteria group bacterium]
MVKKFARLIVILFFFTVLVFAGICSTMAYDYVYYSFNPGEYVQDTCHGSIGKVTCEHQLVFNDPGLNIVALILGKPVSFTAFGSGFFFDNKYPYILTNYHVVETPQFHVSMSVKTDYRIFSRFHLTMDNGKTYPCKLVAVFPEKDMAMLIVDTEEWKPLEFVNLEHVRVGEEIYAIGTPLGIFDNSITDGIVSAKSRNISIITGHDYPAGNLKRWIQHTAHVNPGNSGGPLINRFLINSLE